MNSKKKNFFKISGSGRTWVKGHVQNLNNSQWNFKENEKDISFEDLLKSAPDPQQCFSLNRLYAH